MQVKRGCYGSIFNISELGPLAANKYAVRISVEATAPWGYVFKRSYSFMVNTLKVRRVEAEVPDVVAAYAYTPVRLFLEPSPPEDEEILVTVYSNGRQVYTDTYPTEYLVLSTSEGVAQVEITLKSEKQAPAVLHIKSLRAVKVTPEITVSLAQDTLSITVKPLMVDSRLVIKVYDEEGRIVLVRTMHASSLSKAKSLVNGITTSSGFTSLKLNLVEPGTYTVVVTYETPTGTATQQLQYRIPSTTQFPYIPLIAGLALSIILALTVIILLRKRH